MESDSGEPRHDREQSGGRGDMGSLGLLLLLCAVATSQNPTPRLESIKVENSDGGSMVIAFGYANLNANSTLHRSWFTVNDLVCPVQILNAGITVQPSPRSTYLQYVPSIARVVTAVPVSALEIRFVLYDVF